MAFVTSVCLGGGPCGNVRGRVVPGVCGSVFGCSLPLAKTITTNFFIGSTSRFFMDECCKASVFTSFSGKYLDVPVMKVVTNSMGDILIPLFSGTSTRGGLDDTLRSCGGTIGGATAVLVPVLLFFIFFTKSTVATLCNGRCMGSGGFLEVFVVQSFLRVFPCFTILVTLNCSGFCVHVRIMKVFCV